MGRLRPIAEIDPYHALLISASQTLSRLTCYLPGEHTNRPTSAPTGIVRTQPPAQQMHHFNQLIHDKDAQDVMLHMFHIHIRPTTEISGTGHLLFGLAAAEAEGRARRSQIADVPVSAVSTCWVTTFVEESYVFA
jgi:hypothetical protein